MIELIARRLVEIEEYYHRLTADAVAKAVGPVPRPPIICYPRIDKARPIAVFLDRGAIHIVWDDEYVPFKPVDDVYRRIRCDKYGRTADVESVVYTGKTYHFPYTLGEPQPYETSFHFTGDRPARRLIYVWTWNHMLSVFPSPWLLLRTRYVCTRPSVYMGDREAAERFAERLGCR